jgi:cyclomaltodextrinase
MVNSKKFLLSLENADPGISTPDWVKNAVFYQIFPDRFARSEKTVLPNGIKLQDWDAPGDLRGFYGGDLNGVTEKLDYLQELGINAIYFNPIFQATTYHRYNTYDYYRVDPLLGGNEALRKLIDEAHKRDIKIVLDGVFNHCGRGFWAFSHILENGGKSPYLDWFTINDWPLRPYSYDPEQSSTANYEHWSRYPSLPKFNIHNPGVREYILDVAKYWLEFGIDGWRLDVATEIEDPSFWQDFHRAVKTTNPDAYIVGECWEESMPWLQGDQFDAVMNYYTGWAALKFFGRKSLIKAFLADHGSRDHVTDGLSLASRMDYLHRLYDPEIIYALQVFIDSHDTGRALYNLGDDKSALKLAVLFTMTVPGAPCVYYGDEIGMSAGTDPYCRETFPWQDEGRWDKELLAHYKAAISLRNENPVFRTGSFQEVYADKYVYAFTRKLDNNEVVVMFNASQKNKPIQIPDVTARDLSQLWPEGETLSWKAGKSSLKITIPARSAVVLQSPGPEKS